VSSQLKKEAGAIAKTDPNAAAIARAVEFMAKDLPKSRSGDDARALLVASAKGFDAGASLDAMLAFLKQPATWDQGNRIQLASALAVAERQGKAASTDLEAAAKLLVADQMADGSWQSDIMATWRARAALIASGIQPDFFSVVQADRWIRGVTPENVRDAAATILALELASDVMAENLRRNCLSILRSGQSADTGGWPAPAFDTALAILALSSLEVEPRLARSAYRVEELKDAIANGKKYLVSQQQADGSWPENATPWAVLALLAGA
jgi:hypothetical protein